MEDTSLLRSESPPWPKTMEDTSLLRSESPPWPKTLVATLTLLGVFKGRPINANKPCLLCCRKRTPDNDIIIGDDRNTKTDKETNENRNHPMEDNEAAEDSRLSGECAVCSSLLWNANGVIVNDFRKSVPRRLNNVLCGIMSFLLIALFLGCSLFILWLYIYNFWGNIEEVTHLVSFWTYGIILVGVTLICTVSNAIQYCSRGPMKDGSWCEVLHQDYIARRLRCLAGRRFPPPELMFLSFCMVWVFANNSLQVANLIHYLNATGHGNASVVVPYSEDQPIPRQIFKMFKTALDLAISIIGLPIYASFWYYVLVMRRALTAEFNLVLVFIKRNEGNLDWCRRRIVEINRDFCLLRGVLARLMPFVMATAVLGLTVHISWNYNVYSEAKKNIAKENLLINIFIFSEKFMLLILPLLAVGGLSIDYVWLQFKHTLSRQRSYDYEEFWDHLLNFTTELHAEHKGHNLTLFLSVISLYLGRNISEQKLDYSLL